MQQDEVFRSASFLQVVDAMISCGSFPSIEGFIRLERADIELIGSGVIAAALQEDAQYKTIADKGLK